MSPVDAVLECGRPLGPLVEQAAEGRPPVDPEHQAACRHCRAALAELDGIWTDVGDLAREEVRSQSDLVAAAMRRIRTDAGEQAPPPPAHPRPPVATRGAGEVVLDGSRGRTHIAAGVLAAIAGRVALATPGVRALGAERRGPRRAAPHVELARDSVAITLELVVELGPPLPALVAAVRAAVLAEVAALVGLARVRVHVTVCDVAVER